MFADIRNRKRWNRIILICFLFLNIFRIVMDDTIRSEQALSSQSVGIRKRMVWDTTSFFFKRMS